MQIDIKCRHPSAVSILSYMAGKYRLHVQLVCWWFSSRKFPLTNLVVILVTLGFCNVRHLQHQSQVCVDLLRLLLKVSRFQTLENLIVSCYTSPAQ